MPVLPSRCSEKLPNRVYDATISHFGAAATGCEVLRWLPTVSNRGELSTMYLDLQRVLKRSWPK